jgi:hypothetical protein
VDDGWVDGPVEEDGGARGPELEPPISWAEGADEDSSFLQPGTAIVRKPRTITVTRRVIAFSMATHDCSQAAFHCVQAAGMN